MSSAPRQGRGARFRSDSRAKSAPAGGRPRAAASHAAPRRDLQPGATGVQSVYRRTSYREPSKRHVLPIIIAVVVVAAFLLVVGFVVVPAITNLVTGGSEPAVEEGIEVQINIPEGSSGDQIASILSENDIIPDPKTYYAAVRELNADTQIKPGDYLFTTLQDPQEVVEQLVAGPNVEGRTLTIAEGLTVAQTAARVEKTYGIPADDFIAAAKASTYVDDYPFLEDAANDSLEGFLYPKTYSFTGDPSADDIIRAMLDQYQAEVASLDFDAARELISSRYGIDMSDYDFLTIASIIEREALTDAQRYKVSSTFYNRLKAGMPLQSDATMMYVTGGEVTADDLKIESPYNTYLHKGFPPTPICSPSLASIQAAIAPTDTDYLYFFLTKDSEYFSKTYDEHLAAIEESR